VSALEAGDRRRLMAAAFTTVAALPFLLGGTGKNPSTGVATVGQQANIASALNASSSSTPAAAPDNTSDAATPPGFLIGPAPATDPSEVEIAVPTSRVGNIIEGKASYEPFVAEQAFTGSPCAFAGAPAGTPLVVMDLDNGKSVGCTVFGPPSASARADIVLGTSEFAQMADLGQAPVNVRITW